MGKVGLGGPEGLSGAEPAAEVVEDVPEDVVFVAAVAVGAAGEEPAVLEKLAGFDRGALGGVSMIFLL